MRITLIGKIFIFHLALYFVYSKLTRIKTRKRSHGMANQSQTVIILFSFMRNGKKDTGIHYKTGKISLGSLKVIMMMNLKDFEIT